MKFLTAATALFLAGQLHATTLTDVKTQSANGVFETHLVFDGPVSKDQANIDYINETVQVNLANVQIEHKSNKSIKDDKVKSVLAYKNGKDVRARIIYKKGINASEYQAATSLESTGNELIIKINSNPMPAAVATADNNISDDDLKAAAAWIETADKKSNKLPAIVADTKAAPAAATATASSDKLPTGTRESLAGKKESDIPVLAVTKSQEEIHKPTSGFRVIASLGLVLGLIAGFSVFMKKVLKKTPLNKNSQIKVLTQYYIGPKKSLAIVHVAGESILIGVTDNSINLIKTLALLDEEIPQDNPKDFSKSFKDIFKRAESTQDAADRQAEESEEFAFTKIKDVIAGRLKNMKEM